MIRDDSDRPGGSSDQADDLKGLADVEAPSQDAQLQIFLTDLQAGEWKRYRPRGGWPGEPVRWFRRVLSHAGRERLAGRRTPRPAEAGEEIPPVAGSMPASTISQPGRRAAEDPTAAEGEPVDVVLTALYLEAEQVRLPHEAPYDLEDGQQRFSAWLDGRTGSHDEADP